MVASGERFFRASNANASTEAARLAIEFACRLMSFICLFTFDLSVHGSKASAAVEAPLCIQSDEAAQSARQVSKTDLPALAGWRSEAQSRGSGQSTQPLFAVVDFHFQWDKTPERTLFVSRLMKAYSCADKWFASIGASLDGRNAVRHGLHWGAFQGRGIMLFDRKANLVALVSVFLFGFASLATAQSLPTFNKSFSPSTIGPGSVTSLQFDISNPGATGARGMAFTDNLPAGMTVANAGAIGNTCGGSVSAPYGGTSISLSAGTLPAGASCSISVDVTSATIGVHTNTTGDLTSDQGNSGTASADLTVTGDRPGFSKSFSPNTTFFGDRARLTLTIDNTANGQDARDLRFVDNLPTGMVVANPANSATTCTGGVITASSGSSSVSYAPAFFSDASVTAGSSCTVSVDVVVNAVGQLSNVTGDLTSTVNFSSGLSSGKASALMTGQVERLSFNKEFVDDPTPPGGSTTLRFSIRNLDRDRTATNISFTDDLDAVVSGMVASSLPGTPCGGSSSVTGSSVLSMTGGTLTAGETCFFDVVVDIPTSATPGSYDNVTSNITADFSGSSGAGSPATDSLFVEPSPGLSMEFTDDPSGAGQTVTVQYVITNTSTTSAATDISFTSEYDTVLPTADSTPADGFCGAGSTATYTPLIDSGSAQPARLTVSGASLAAAASCTFDLVLNVSDDASGGLYPHTTSAINAVVDGTTYGGDAAGDDLQLLGGPLLTKSFVDDPVAGGDTVTLEFTLMQDAFAGGDASAIAFTDDLDAVITGLVATNTPLSDVCGTGSALTGTMTLTLSGGQVAAGEECTFSVTLQVPASATAGPHTNVTSSVVAMVAGQDTRSRPATDDLLIAGLSMTKEFTDDPVLPGGTVNLRYTLFNDSPTSAATNIMFQDDLDDAVENMTVSGLPLNDVCGTGSSLVSVSGDQLIVFQSGELAAGASCTFDVSLNVPAATLPDRYQSRTSNFFGTVDGNFIRFRDAEDTLVVEADILGFSKEFTDDPASPGDAVTLQFTISNASSATALTNIAFTDDLAPVLAGLTKPAGTMSDLCGPGSELTGTTLLTFTGGSLAAGEVCTFEVRLMVDASTPLGATGTNITSNITGDAGGVVVTGPQATDTIQIDFLRLSKSFDGPAEAGDTVSLTFTIENLGNDRVDRLSFSDDLDAMMSGLTSVSFPATGVCGDDSDLSGTDIVRLRNASLLPNGSCTFSVDVLVPASTPVGTYTNVTSVLTQDGVTVAGRATATLDIIIVAPVDTDADGVLDVDDECPNTVIPESVPTRHLKNNRYALVDNDFIFDTPRVTNPQYTTTDTRGCSCEQIIDIVGLGNGHTKFGCSGGAMKNWVCDGESTGAIVRSGNGSYSCD